MSLSDMGGTNQFQSTLPREERLSLNRRFSPALCYFNPRSHEMSDGIGAASIKAFTISIHAPTRGATFPNIDIPDIAGFQSTLPREERQQYCTKNLFIFIQYRQ